MSPDPLSSRMVWNLVYDELPPADMRLLQAFFTACSGPFSAFTFIDPADNMLTYSVDLTSSAWTVSPNILVRSGLTDPLGGLTAFTVTNTGQAAGILGQTVAVPGNYQYCFSVWVQSAAASTVTLNRIGTTANSNTEFTCHTTWNRIVSAGRLNDAGTALTVQILLEPGQTVELFGPQLEPQIEPSRYRPTSSKGGVYPNAHWGSNQIWFSADGPSSFATSFSIESVL